MTRMMVVNLEACRFPAHDDMIGCYSTWTYSWSTAQLRSLTCETIDDNISHCGPMAKLYMDKVMVMVMDMDMEQGSRWRVDAKVYVVL